MAQPDGGIGNVKPNAALVQMAMSYSRSRMLCAAAGLGVASAAAFRMIKCGSTRPLCLRKRGKEKCGEDWEQKKGQANRWLEFRHDLRCDSL